MIDSCLEELSNVVFGVVPIENDNKASEKEQPLE
jgi:hypothetical protein